MKTRLCAPKRLVAFSVTLLLGACTGAPPGPPSAARQRLAAAMTAEVFKLDPGDTVLAAAGDIADCGYKGGDAARATAKLLLKYPGVTVIAPGDLSYLNGTSKQFAQCYDKVWGKLKERTRPAPGNHDYGIYPPAFRNNAGPYFRYFGANAGTGSEGYYSFDLGDWHIVSLNSMVDQVRSAPSMSRQVKWLKEDLDKTDKSCLLAFWHQPLFSSGSTGTTPRMPAGRWGGSGRPWPITRGTSSSTAMTTTTNDSACRTRRESPTRIRGSGSSWWERGAPGSVPSRGCSPIMRRTSTTTPPITGSSS